MAGVSLQVLWFDHELDGPAQTFPSDLHFWMCLVVMIACLLMALLRMFIRNSKLDATLLTLHRLGTQ